MHINANHVEKILFQGVAKQVIDLDGGTYKNELYVGGKGRDGDEGAWLSAVLALDCWNIIRSSLAWLYSLQ